MAWGYLYACQFIWSDCGSINICVCVCLTSKSLKFHVLTWYMKKSICILLYKNMGHRPNTLAHVSCTQKPSYKYLFWNLTMCTWWCCDSFSFQKSFAVNIFLLFIFSLWISSSRMILIWSCVYPISFYLWCTLCKFPSVNLKNTTYSHLNMRLSLIKHNK